MQLTELNKIFYIENGNKFDANKMEFNENGEIDFISRKTNNNGRVGTVEKYNVIEPYEEGLITVSLGGSFLLSSFVQPRKFYTAQNVAVLTPKKEMSHNEKIFYCKCISMNRVRYSAFGREANRTLKILKIPKKAPSWISNYELSSKYDGIDNSVSDIGVDLSDVKWKNFNLKKIFQIRLGKPIHKNKIKEFSEENREGYVPYITRTTKNNGTTFFVNRTEFDKGVQEGNSIIIGAEGIRAFYQESEFITGNKINVLSNSKLNIFSAMFINVILNLEISKKFNYGRGLVKSRLEKLSIYLPKDEEGNPDFAFMENYIKSLPYSKSLET